MVRTPLTPKELEELTAEHPDWSIDADRMSREFTFADFSAAIGFVTRTALAAEALDHHPDIDIRWNRVKLNLSTHSAGALTELDRKLAGTVDGFV